MRVFSLALAVLAPGFFAACSGEPDEAAGPGAIPGGGPVLGADGGIGVQPDGAAWPPLPPYVVDNSPLSPDYSIFDHGKECFDRFQVAVPDFDCDGPDSSRLKVEVDGVEVTSYVPAECDKPSLVGNKYACVPGGRVTKWEEVNKYGHTIATVVACRRSSFSALDDGRFDNIAVLQSDLQNNETCWYQIRKDASFVARGIPAPYGKGRTKGDAADRKARAIYDSPVTLTSDGTECYRCHDNRVWLRTPWINPANQAPSRSGKVNAIPSAADGLPTYLGKAYRDWNRPENRPAQIRIDAAKLDQSWPPTAAERSAIAAGSMAPSNACTQCHSIARADIANAAQGTCNHFARYWMPNKPSSFDSTVSGNKISAHGNSFPLNAWMPPSAAETFPNDAAYRAFYRRAFAALEVCCDDPTLSGCSPP